MTTTLARKPKHRMGNDQHLRSSAGVARYRLALSRTDAADRATADYAQGQRAQGSRETARRAHQPGTRARSARRRVSMKGILGGRRRRSLSWHRGMRRACRWSGCQA
ncbi:predicted protein [Verticillium alfalfae VaMs.102]|uniref:Predicted protein n=1 Tax=Verticillium alfalfae (strain VaMs.102 / ATCC MYA-4576 / FGSC 10136) TaxID=526221 RepID=C9SHH5_VERA1|nr:predicted protein [Verticillium alfalfae VaMs.102]EEY18398.1 predicted protein [Verticillium alfalfae VaMs.102]